MSTEIVYSSEKTSFDNRLYANPDLKKTEVSNKWQEAYQPVKELLIEKNPDDSESTPGFIYSLPREYIKVGAPNYSRYICRGSTINYLVYKLFPFTDSEDSPLDAEQKKEIISYLNSLRKIYQQRTEDRSQKLMRTADDMVVVKSTIVKIVDILGEALLIEKKSRAANA